MPLRLTEERRHRLVLAMPVTCFRRSLAVLAVSCLALVQPSLGSQLLSTAHITATMWYNFGRLITGNKLLLTLPGVD